mmetsp:Transcript_91370/g.175228  ORF Transcript_91370/g.175228 Transcript_91370/m.175228 type:complete len:106 (-) Transcript_91370:52-369(-)
MASTWSIQAMPAVVAVKLACQTNKCEAWPEPCLKIIDQGLKAVDQVNKHNLQLLQDVPQNLQDCLPLHQSCRGRTQAVVGWQACTVPAFLLSLHIWCCTEQAEGL